MIWFVNGRPVVYQKFAPGQPDNAGDKEACVEVFAQKSLGYLWNEVNVMWNDVRCDAKLGYICQTYVTTKTTL